MYPSYAVPELLLANRKSPIKNLKSFCEDAQQRSKRSIPCFANEMPAPLSARKLRSAAPGFLILPPLFSMTRRKWPIKKSRILHNRRSKSVMLGFAELLVEHKLAQNREIDRLFAAYSSTPLPREDAKGLPLSR
jgi:hypothetical protein